MDGITIVTALTANTVKNDNIVQIINIKFLLSIKEIYGDYRI